MRYGVNKKTRILIGTVLEVEIGTKATALGRRRPYFATKSDVGGGYTKVDTINIRIFKLHTPEPLASVTDGDSGDRAADSTMTTTGDTAITHPVSIQVLRCQHYTL